MKPLPKTLSHGAIYLNICDPPRDFRDKGDDTLTTR